MIVVLLGGGDAGGRLVEQNDLGIEREGGGDVEQLLLALRQRRGGGLEPRLEPENLAPPRDARLDFGSADRRENSRQRFPWRETTAAAIVSATVSFGKI